MAESPSVNKDRVLSCSVYCNGTKLKDTYSLVSATVRLELNRIGKATLKFNAGNMDKQTFDESDDSLFKPGNTIRLDAGGVNKEETLFEGIIIGLRILADKDFRSCMVVECRNNTYSATQGRKNRIFEKKNDNDIIKESVKQIGVEFDDIVTAEMAGAYKPSDKGFHLSQKRLGLTAADILHAGFGFKYDITPGSRLGYETCWVNRQGEPRPLNVWETFMVGDLKTLAQLIKLAAIEEKEGK